MKSTSAILAALASTAVAQPHGHQHAHLHPARLEHQHDHDKRVLETKVVVEWVTETVVEIIDSTATEWITEGAPTVAPTTLLTTTSSVATTSSAGQFYEGASTAEPAATPTTPVVVAQPVETSSSSSSSIYVAPPAPATTEESTTSAYVPPVVEPTTSSISTTEAAPVVVEPTSTSTSAAPAETSTTTTPVSGTTFEGKITWIGPTDGAYSACGPMYDTGKMYVAVNPGVLDCGTDGQGTPMTIIANGATVNAWAVDKCMGCDTDHIDVDTSVYLALGYSTDLATDGGMHDAPGQKWTLAAT